MPILLLVSTWHLPFIIINLVNCIYVGLKEVRIERSQAWLTKFPIKYVQIFNVYSTLFTDEAFF